MNSQNCTKDESVLIAPATKGQEVKTSPNDLLTPKEEKSLLEFERTVDTHMYGFFEVGTALASIRDQRLYRKGWRSFGEYLNERWNMSRAYAHRVIDSAQVVHNLLPIGNTSNFSESSLRPLTALPAEVQLEVMKEALKKSRRPTRKEIQSAIQEVNCAPQSKCTTGAGRKTESATAGTELAQEIPAKLEPGRVDRLIRCSSSIRELVTELQPMFPGNQVIRVELAKVLASIDLCLAQFPV